MGRELEHKKSACGMRSARPDLARTLGEALHNEELRSLVLPAAGACQHFAGPRTSTGKKGDKKAELGSKC